MSDIRGRRRWHHRGRVGAQAPPPPRKPIYSVVVGNIGTVYRGDEPNVANETYDNYVALSLSGASKAGDESVSLYEDEELDRNFLGAIDIVDSIMKRYNYSKAKAIQHVFIETWPDPPYPPNFKARLLYLIKNATG